MNIGLLLKCLFLLIGIFICLFFLIILAAAIVNLPYSWVGLLYSIFGILSGASCIMYWFHQNKILIVISIPAIIFIIVTLLNNK